MNIDSDIFKNSKFKFPMKCSEGVLWEIFSIKSCDMAWGVCNVDKNGKCVSATTEGELYKVTGEVEYIKGQDMNFDFIANPIEYLKNNPHLETNRKVVSVMMTDKELIENEL